MSIENLYAKLAEQSDATTFQDLSGVCNRARQRRSRRIWAAGSVAALVVVAVASGQLLFRPTPPPQLTDSPPVAVTETPHRFPTPGGVNLVVADDKRVYTLQHQEDNAIKVGAIDLATGKAAWPETVLGTYSDTSGIRVNANAVVVIGEHNLKGVKDPEDYVLHSIDPASGKLRFRIPFDMHTQMELFGKVVVLVNPAKPLTRAFDTITGKELWRSSDPVRPNGTTAWIDSSAKPRLAGQFATPWQLYSRSLVQILNDGSVVVRDLFAGTASSHPAVTADMDDRPFVIDGYLYFYDDSGERLVASLNGNGLPEQLQGKRNGIAGVLRTCGPGEFCLIDRKTPEDVELVMIAADTHRELWRKKVPAGVEEVYPTGDSLLVVNTGGMQVYDLAGRLLIDRPNVTVATWLTADTVLTWEQESKTQVKLTAITLIPEQETPVAVLNATSYCAWNGTTVVCPTADGFTTVKITG